LIGEGFLPKGKHSKKPDAMYELIEDRSMGPYLEMFARNTRPGWDSWGDEIKDEE
jgi:N6-adenosine-specific RNA methylase IME4